MTFLQVTLCVFIGKGDSEIFFERKEGAGKHFDDVSYVLHVPFQV